MKKIEQLREQVARIKAVPVLLRLVEAEKALTLALDTMTEHELRLDAITREVNRMTAKEGDA